MLREILSISGKPGLQRIISNGARTIIVESLVDGKRFQAFSNAKIIALQDISVYTEDEDMPLVEVFERMYNATEGKEALSHKESEANIVAFFENVLPEYDRSRVYLSDMKKIVQWFNLLVKNNLLNFDQETEQTEEQEA